MSGSEYWNWLMQYGVRSRLEVERGALGLPPCSPLLNLFRGPSIAEQRADEERDRREWIDGIRRRLGLVAEVHRCRVYPCRPGDWGWFCQRKDCGEVGHFLPSQGEAATEAQEHTRAFVPEPPEEAPGELDWDGYVPLVECAAYRFRDGYRQEWKP